MNFGVCKFNVAMSAGLFFFFSAAFILIFLSPQIYYNYKNFVLSEEMDRELNRMNIASHAKILAKHDEIQGGFSSNYCIMFSGILIQTNLSKESFYSMYPEVRAAWFLGHNKIYLTGWDDSRKIVSLSCYTCYPKGIADLISEVPCFGSGNYAVVYKWETYMSDYDFRCN
ncbi:MAG: hypothetical protein OEZ34_04045 [Spirochaetia bacterium]|nr:hypothetical protein [Spirochaetia bacterium]